MTSRPLSAAGIACGELRVKPSTMGGVSLELELMLAVKTLTCVLETLECHGTQNEQMRQQV